MKTDDNPDGTDKSVYERMRAKWSRDLPKWMTDNSRPFFTPETSPELVQWGVRMSLQASLKALIDCNRADTETDFRAELPKITTPTLIIHGDKDVSMPLERTGRRAARLIPGSQLKVYEGAPHGLMLTYMDRFNLRSQYGQNNLAGQLPGSLHDEPGGHRPRQRPEINAGLQPY